MRNYKLQTKYLKTLLLLIHCSLIFPSLFAQQWQEPSVIEDAPAFQRLLSVQQPRLYGKDVKLLQQRLIDLGYTSVGTVDGYFGPMTNSAFERFSSYNGVIYDGIVDSDAWDSLFSADRKVNDRLPELGDRKLVFAFGMWGLIEQAGRASNQNLDPSERVDGFLHFRSGSMEPVTARAQWFWESGPYSPNDFSPTIIFESRDEQGKILPRYSGIFTSTPTNPFYESTRLNDIPQEIQRPLSNWFITQGIDAPIIMKSGYFVSKENSGSMYFLYLSYNSEYRDERTSDGYNLLLRASQHLNDWHIALIEGTIFDTESYKTLQMGFQGFSYILGPFADIDNNGIVDIVLNFRGGAWGNGEKAIFLNKDGSVLRTIYGRGD